MIRRRDDVSNDLPDHNEFNVNGASVELLYRVLSPYKDGMGLAFYLEPEISVRDHMTGEDNIERALETHGHCAENVTVPGPTSTQARGQKDPVP